MMRNFLKILTSQYDKRNNSGRENICKGKDYLGHCKQKWSFPLMFSVKCDSVFD